MHNHEPEGYACPFCRIVAQARDSMEGTEVVFHDETVTAFLGLLRWEKNPVDVLVVPNRHIENPYDLPLELAPALQRVTRGAAIGLKALTRREGVSTRQRHEPAGGSGRPALPCPRLASRGTGSTKIGKFPFPKRNESLSRNV
ncbi:MAG: hypothetical protein AB1750_01890 [Chloroflexota bacterium]